MHEDRVTADTARAEYTARLLRGEAARWRWWLVQAPYRWHVRQLGLGFTLDLGCGVGRNLGHLRGNGVGVDHNPTSVREARARGLTAYTVEEFRASIYARPGMFDSLLAAHLVEHLAPAEAATVIGNHLGYVRPGGKIVFITPQERGHASDPTHVDLADFEVLDRLAADLELTVARRYSFPLPRRAGRLFTYNEFVVVARVPGGSG